VCRRHRRQGVATAIVAELTQRASDLGCVSVRARVDPKNLGSITALLSNDYVAVPIAEDVEFVLLRRVLGSGPSSRAMP
jgi:RimJ/RimL family protein N-acetyltransferase